MQANQAWLAVRGQLQMEMPKATFDTWIQHADFVEFDDGYIVIGVQNAYARDWLESRLTDTVGRLLQGVMGRSDIEVRFVVLQNEQQDQAVVEDSPSESAEYKEEPTTNAALNSSHTFGTFVITSTNRLAHAAALAVAENPGNSYNPLYLYGPIGVGKTQLLQAIGNQCHKDGKDVVYVTAEEFTNGMIEAIRYHQMEAFRQKHRRVKVFLCDGVEFLAGKEATTEEFFHTFNALMGRGSQVVLTSQLAPKNIKDLEERLRSRFEMGLLADIQPPGREESLAILQFKAEARGLTLPEEVLKTIAILLPGDVGRLEGGLTRVSAMVDLRDMEATPELVSAWLTDMVEEAKPEPDRIVNAVASLFGLTEAVLISEDRSREISFPRQVAMYLLREDAGISLPQIGEMLGGRDHTTVMYGTDKVAGLLKEDPALQDQIAAIRNQVRPALPMAA